MRSDNVSSVPCAKLVAVIATLLALFAVPASAQSADQELEAEILAALDGWIGSVASGDPELIAGHLAPEYQIQRANGAGYDRETYLTSNLPLIADIPAIDGLVLTANGDLVVARYVLVVDEIIDGAQVNPFAPRLTVLRRDGDDWLIVAHANFSNPN
ncbi:MAG: nuclear transport factor 2 family protein [Pseudomonadota bacterium]